MRIVQKDMLSLGDQGKLKYAALSYVWGAAGKQCLNLHVRNLEALSSRLEGYSIPIAKTIRDAIDVTRRMGLQYIWVDSLCVVQHDEFGEDDPSARLSQIEQMDRIFGHAALTIVAADGLDAAAGLTGISTKAPRTQIAREIQPNVNVLLAVQYNSSLGECSCSTADMSASIVVMVCCVKTCLLSMPVMVRRRFPGCHYQKRHRIPSSNIPGTVLRCCCDRLSSASMRIC
jgi:hypothetical protein